MDHGTASVPTGYKVVRVKLDDKGQPMVARKISSLAGSRRTKQRKGRWMGRPVGIVFSGDGTMYVSDDSGGRIYHIAYTK